MRKVILNSLLSLFLCLLMGGSLHPFRMIVVRTKGIEDASGVRLIDPNDPNDGPYSIKITQTSEGNTHLSFNFKNSMIKIGKPCKVKYHWLYYLFDHFIVTEGRLGSDGKKYPVVIDMGSSIVLVVNDTHIRENKLAIYPIRTTKGHSTGLGFCYLPELKIGEIKLLNLPCRYYERHTEVQIFGLPIGRDDFILVGLPTLRIFSYIAFDNIKKEMEFSSNQKFEPKDSEQWTRYSLSIEVDSNNNAGLFIEIPIAEKKTKLKLDTGFGGGLIVGELIWEEMQERLQAFRLRKGKMLFHLQKTLKGKKSVIGKLKVGKRIIQNAEILIFPDSDLSAILKGPYGLLGMQYFKDTIIVLDFERKLMWVKNKI